jgi:hypothetical protein
MIMLDEIIPEPFGGGLGSAARVMKIAEIARDRASSP